VKLQGVLQYHVISGSIKAGDLKDSQVVKTLSGQEVTIVKRDGGVYVNDAKVVTADVIGSNGVVHIVDKVILPKTGPFYAYATFTAGSVRGTIEFVQQQAGKATSVKFNLKCVDKAACTQAPWKGYHVHESAIDDTAENKCASTGPHFAIDRTAPLCSLADTGEVCETGDLSGRHGPLPSTSLSFQDSYDDLVLDLSTGDDSTPLPNSVAGRSVVIHDTTGARIGCANIVPGSAAPTGAPSYSPTISGTCVYAKDSNCFDQWQYLCEGCCRTGLSVAGATCFDDVFTIDRCCQGPDVITEVPTCAYEKDSNCFDAIYSCKKCCETDLNVFGGSCWDAVYTKTRCCKNAIIDSFTSDPWATSGGYSQVYPAYPEPPIIWVGGNRRSAYGLHIDENGVTVDSRGQPLKSQVIFGQAPEPNFPTAQVAAGVSCGLVVVAAVIIALVSRRRRASRATMQASQEMSTTAVVSV